MRTPTPPPGRSWILAALACAALLGGCLPPLLPEGPDLRAPGDGPGGVPDGAAARCRSTAECSPGQLCQGPPGCAMAWTCVPTPACTKDLVPFCGCDGMTFRSSSTCPGSPYRHAGPCGSCAPQQVKGVGACAAVLGTFWDGTKCVTLSGCSCEGPDCMNGYRSLEECQEAHQRCPVGLRSEGAPCTVAEQCESNVCEGQGCGPEEARCAPKVRACTRDLVPYCGCDGMPFRASSTCPNRPYRNKGPC